MLYFVLFALTCFAALLGIGYLLWKVGGRKSKKQDAAKKAEPAQSKLKPSPAKKGKSKAHPEPPAEHTPPAPQRPPCQIDLAEVPIPGSDLHYCTPFGPLDSVTDVWSKFQALTSTEPVTARLVPTEHNAPIVHTPHPADGTVQSTPEAFREDFTSGVRRNSGPTIWRAVRALSSFGIPPSTLEGAYRFFTGTLHMEANGVHMMGVSFAIKAVFEPNLGLIPGHFRGRNEYLHSEIPPNETSGRSRADKTPVVVGFPWAFTGISLYSEDAKLETDAAKIVKSIVVRYAKYLKQERVAAPAPDDPTRKVTVISDGMVIIAILEGTARGGRGFIQINYRPAPGSRLDEGSFGDADFVEFARRIREREERRLKDEAEAVVNTSF